MKAIISKIVKITAGKFHAWCESDVGIIRKPNGNIPKYLWDIFFNREIKKIAKPIKLKWYQKLWKWFIKLLRKIWK